MSKRGPSALVNDLRDRRPPLQRSNSGRPGASSSAARSIHPVVETETPSAQPRYPGGICRRRHSNAGLPNLASRITGQQNVPSRTTKISEKLVLIPSTSGEESADCRPQDELEQGPKQAQAEAQQSVRSDFWDGETLRGDTWAERLGKAHRGERLARVTAYCTAQAMKLKATAEFIKTKHEARTKLYDDCLYVIYHIPLLPGIDGYRIRSRPVLMQPGSKKSILDLMIERGERGDHYESDLELYGTSPELANGASTAPGAQSQRAVPRMETQIDTQRKTISNPLLPLVREYAEMFVFSYGVVVLWNFSEAQERDMLADLTFAELEDSKNNNTAAADKLLVDTGKRLPANTTTNNSLMTRPLADSDVETEEFHFQYSEDVRKPRVFNDMITLMPRSDHMVKLTISHAIAQSTKLCYFEERMNETMSSCENVPKVLAKTGELKMDRTEVLRMMGKLYKNRVDINLSSNVLDVPNFFWDSEPVLQPLYGAIREYLEIDSRIEKLNAKAEVFLDLATMLSDSVADTKMSNITIIIIVLIVISIFVTIAETSMRFNILQKGRSGQRGEESDRISGDDDNAPGVSRNDGNDVELADLIRGKHRMRMAAYQLGNMTPEQRMVWAGNLSADEKANLCGSDVICRTFAGI